VLPQRRDQESRLHASGGGTPAQYTVKPEFPVVPERLTRLEFELEHAGLPRRIHTTSSAERYRGDGTRSAAGTISQTHPFARQEYNFRQKFQLKLPPSCFDIGYSLAPMTIVLKRG
jgi:hypothetical protein